MPRFHLIATTASLALAVAAPAVAGPSSPSPRTCPLVTERDIEGQFLRFSEAWATGDPDVVTALFTAKPVLLPTVSNQPKTTPEAVRDYFVAFLRNRPVARIDSSTIEIDCETASRVGTWTISLTEAGTGRTRDVKARYSFIYRYEDGDWKIDHLHSSTMPEIVPAPGR